MNFWSCSSASVVHFAAREPDVVVEVDSDYHALRRIAEEDLPYCLNRTLEERGGRVRWKGADAVFAPLAKRLADAAKADLLPAGADSPQDGKPLISLVVAVCSSTAVAIVAEMLFTSWMTCVICCSEVCACCVSVWMVAICCAMRAAA